MVDARRVHEPAIVVLVIAASMPLYDRWDHDA
jgi:hypothetical protein